jgi:hypothetical protein
MIQGLIWHRVTLSRTKMTIYSLLYYQTCDLFGCTYLRYLPLISALTTGFSSAGYHNWFKDTISRWFSEACCWRGSKVGKGKLQLFLWLQLLSMLLRACIVYSKASEGATEPTTNLWLRLLNHIFIHNLIS